jgi:hypothetical protein
MKPKGQAQETIQAQPAAVIEIAPEKELKMLRGFRDLVNARWGIFVGRRLKGQDLSEKTETERKAVTEIRKEISKNLPTWVEKGDKVSYDAKIAALNAASETLAEAKTATGIPEVVKKLAQGQRYLDNEAIPNSLSELGTPVQPVFSLAEWLETRLEEQKKAKKAKK